jgi:translation initiation factor 1
MPPSRRPGDDARTVWSSEAGDLRKPSARGDEGRRGGRPRERREELPDDGVVRVKREVAGRRGKPVTTVHGVPPDALKELAGHLKRRCGSGGSTKRGIIEIQGDHRDVVVAELEARGYDVKRAGG